MVRFFRLACVAVLAAAAPAAAQPRLAARLDAVLDRPGLDDGFWGVLVVDAATGQPVYSRNAQRRFVPASNTKLYSGAAVLDLYGPAHRFTTRLYATGPVDDAGTLRGDLVVQGGGDPSLGSQPYADVPVDKFAVLRAWADSLKARGIRRIEGRIVGDDDVFDDQALGAGWTWDDEVFYYSAQLSGLTFGDGCLDVALRGSDVGAPARLTTPDAAEGFATFDNASRTVSGPPLREGYARLPGTNHFVLSSRVPAGTTDRECVSVHNPTRYAAHALRHVLRAEGISVTGAAEDLDDLGTGPVDYAALAPLVVHASAPLSVLVRDMEKESLNHYAEFFLKHVGRADASPVPTEAAPLGSAARGLEVMKTGLLRRAGLTTDRFGLVDGSGLSRMNVVSPAQTVALLRYLHRHPDAAVAEAFREALPIGGVDGTLQNRLGALRGRVRAKTGTLTGASCLSGYLRTTGGRTLVFSIMSNHYSAPSSASRRAQDSLLTVLSAL